MNDHTPLALEEFFTRPNPFKYLGGLLRNPNGPQELQHLAEALVQTAQVDLDSHTVLTLTSSLDSIVALERALLTPLPQAATAHMDWKFAMVKVFRWFRNDPSIPIDSAALFWATPPQRVAALLGWAYENQSWCRPPSDFTP